jgi:hypothetical protein
MSDIPGENISASSKTSGTDISTGSHHHRRHHHIARRRAATLFFFSTQTIDAIAHSYTYHVRYKIGYGRSFIRAVRPFYYTFLYRYTLF